MTIEEQGDRDELDYLIFLETVYDKPIYTLSAEVAVTQPLSAHLKAASILIRELRAEVKKLQREVES